MQPCSPGARREDKRRAKAASISTHRSRLARSGAQRPAFMSFKREQCDACWLLHMHASWFGPNQCMHGTDGVDCASWIAILVFFFLPPESPKFRRRVFLQLSRIFFSLCS
ncbi:hypothetical protein BRADI_1g35105v3 [Brachypodium distachyon]|uniref:Uncharacterized protein n=1 Tax=Brachypodium distachyon TaxID=15368 RepID=A0A0Q3JIK6_BRADI|nr:hypothetical protein BRADI_1g35105v3 [Brachypodium distachyon]